MNSFLLQLVALASSVVLALPPGWCSGFMRHDRAEPAPVQTTCCQRTAHDKPSEQEETPVDSSVQCCCERDATLPEKSVQPTDTPALALPLVAGAILADLSRNAGGEAAETPFPSGPRLHVLQCVWRC